MRKEIRTALDFLGEMYLPGYLTVCGQGDYVGRDKAFFVFNPVEPQVTLLSDKYVTPRGTHIMVSQASYCFFEYIVGQEMLNIEVDGLRNLGFDGRLKLVEFNQKFRKEIPISRGLQGRFDLKRLRVGTMPVVKMDFDFGGRAITGSLTAVIVSHPVPQTNVDIMRR